MRRPHPAHLLRLALCATLAAAVGIWAAVPAAAVTPVKRVRCALPYVTGGPNFFCSGQHKILFTANGFTNNNATIKAELLALDATGKVLGAIPVNSGDLARLTSGAAAQFKLTSKGNQHEAVAPVPLLRVTAEDGVDRAVAYCSPVPYARVFEPDGSVVSGSEGDVTRVLAAIPLTEGSDLAVLVDGVDVFAQLGIGNPESCRANNPCGGDITVNGASVTIADLVVESAPNVGTLSSNTVRFTAQGLGCGGHVFSVSGDPVAGARPAFVSQKCHKDPLADKGLSSGFAIAIASPQPGESGLPIPTPVTGEVCSGRPIATVNINGKVFSPPADCTVLAGDGVTSADTYKCPIDTEIGVTALKQDVSTGDAALGTFDAGSNRLSASATDDLGNRTFASLIFATGTTQNPGVPAAAVQQLAARARERATYKGMLEHLGTQAAQRVVDVLQNGALVTVPNAFIVGLSAASIQKVFNQRCTDPVNGVGKKFADTVSQRILNDVADQVKSVSSPCSCDPSITIGVTSVDVDPTDISCPVTFHDGRFSVRINLPSVTVHASASGSCETEDPVFGGCLEGLSVSGSSTTTISGIRLDFDITEDNMLQNQASQNSLFVSGTASSNTSMSTNFCGASVLCDVVVSILTFGLVDMSPSIDVTNVSSFVQQVGSAEPDPVKLGEIKVDEEVVDDFNQTLSGALSSVRITSSGLIAGLNGTFATLSVDPEVEITPGALVTGKTLPALSSVIGNQGTFMALADDTINQMFASMTLAGGLKTQCKPSGKTVGDLFPAACDTLTSDAGDSAAALAQGICHGIRTGTSCESLTGATNLLRALKQGACHGVRGDNCNTIPLPGGAIAAATEKATCNGTPKLGLNETQNVLACTRQDIPPRMVLPNSGSPTNVAASLRLNDLSVAMVVDRDGDDLDGALETLPECFAPGAPIVGDCRLMSTCLDINLKFSLQFQTCTDGKPGIVSKLDPVEPIQILNREAGVLCGGGGPTGDATTAISQAASNDVVKNELVPKAEQLSPPICVAGLNLGGFVSCTDPGLFTIESGGSADFKDYLGLTCAP